MNNAQNSIKNTRINSEVQKELSEIISRELKDPRIHPMTTVCIGGGDSGSRNSARRISVFSEAREAGKDTVQGLKSAASFIRTQLAKRINLRNTPELSFILDQSIEYGVNMTRLINEVTAGMNESGAKEEDSEEELLEDTSNE